MSTASLQEGSPQTFWQNCGTVYTIGKNLTNDIKNFANDVIHFTSAVINSVVSVTHAVRGVADNVESVFTSFGERYQCSTRQCVFAYWSWSF